MNPPPPTPDHTASEQAFLTAYDPSRFERHSIAVDVVLLSIIDDALHAFLVRRAEHPFKDRWALPGGFVKPSESLEETAERVLRVKAGVKGVFLEQLFTFGAPKRDPRTRVISVAYFALIPSNRLPAGASPAGRADTLWGRFEPGTPRDPNRSPLVSPTGEPLQIAFDHAAILSLARTRLRAKVSYSPVGYELLAGAFPLRDLQRVHEIILGRDLNKDSFRRKMLATGDLKPAGKFESDSSHRPAELYVYKPGP